MSHGVIRTLLVDDEPVARQVLREELDAFPDIEIAGEAENGRQALQKIAELQPDLVFLDLQMPGMSGFEVVRNLSGPHLPAVVIVTAFDQYAIEAFDAGAVDYLLKPISETRLQKAIDRARAWQGKPAAVAENLARIASAGETPNPAKRKVVGRNGSEYYLLDADDVLAFQADGELVWIVTMKQRLLASQSLRTIETRMLLPHFQRVHRNAIVNVNHVRKMSALSSQRWLITLSNSLQLVVSKRQAHTIRQMLHH
jgi:two-component system LytT family response regulator